MPTPSNPATIGRPDLGACYEDFDLMAAAKGFVGLKAMPATRVQVGYGTFSRVKLAQLLSADRDARRAPGAGYGRQEWEFEPVSFNCSERGWEEPLDDRERGVYGYTGVRFEQVGADRAVHTVLRDVEAEIAGKCQDSTTYAAQAASAGTVWATKASATPVKNILDAKELFRTRVGMYPNGIVIPAPAWNALRQCAEFLDFIKYGGSDVDPTRVGPEALAAIVEIPHVLIADAVQNTKSQGESPVMADIWNKTIVPLLRLAETDDLREVSFGRTFMFEDVVIEQYRDEPRRSDVIRARTDVDPKVIHSECVQLITGVLS